MSATSEGRRVTTVALFFLHKCARKVCRIETLLYLCGVDGADGRQTHPSNPHDLILMGAATFCSVQIASACGQWDNYYSLADVERMSANKFIVNALSEMGYKHGMRMVAQSLTEAVCMRGEDRAVWTFDHDGELTKIVVTK